MNGVPRRSPNDDLVGVPGGARKLTTPALLVQLPALNANLAAMVELAQAAKLKLRPHAKTHKCAAIAREQIRRGAVGVCCATPHEVVMLAGDGVLDILLTAPAVQPRQISELVKLHEQGYNLMIVLDHPSAVQLWQDHLGKSSRPLPVLVDIDIGMARTGVSSAERAVEIVRRVKDCAALRYAGVQAYSGLIQHIEKYAERRTAYLRQLDHLNAVLKLLAAAGYPAEIISGGGTGSFAVDAERGLFTECQVGSYLFMDVEYNAIELFKERANPYQTSLLLRTTVISANADRHITINAGSKSLASDGPAPQVYGVYSACRYESFGDEFGRIVVDGESERPSLGAFVDLVTPHCDPTINLHDFLHVVDGDTLVDIWPIVARGTL